MVRVLKEIYPTAKKTHMCEFCACKIIPGQKYVRQTCLYDGEVYDFITHQECADLASKRKLYHDCDDSGLDGDSFRATLEEYVHCNHYDSEARKIDSNWDLASYDIVKKILEEIKKEIN